MREADEQGVIVLTALNLKQKIGSCLLCLSCCMVNLNNAYLRCNRVKVCLSVCLSASRSVVLRYFSTSLTASKSISFIIARNRVTT